MTTLIVNRWPLTEVPYHRWLEDGAAVLLTDRASLDVPPAELAGFAEVVAMDGRPDASWELEAHLLRDRHRFDRVLALAERDLLLAARLRGAWGLPGQDRESATAYRDKLVMKQLLSRAGVPVARFAAVDHPTDLHEFARRTGGPVVVKPRRGASAEGVVVIRDEPTLHRVLRDPSLFCEDRPAHLLAEEYLAHEMYQVNGLVRDGQPVIAWPARATTGLGFEGGRTFLSHTLDVGSPLVQPLLDLAEMVLRTLPGPPLMLFHAEIFGLADGRLVVNEIGSRIGGDQIREEYELALGVDLVERFVRLALGQALDCPPIRLPLRQSGHAHVPPSAGTVRRLPGSPQPVPGVRSEVHVREGQVLEPASSSSDTIASFLATGRDTAEVRRRLEEAVAWFTAGTLIAPRATGSGCRR